MATLLCDPKTRPRTGLLPPFFLFANILFNAYQNLWIFLAQPTATPEFNATSA